MVPYPKVRSVHPLEYQRLRVVFVNGAVRVYDCTPLLASPEFQLLANDVFFRSVRPDTHGYGVIWNDEVDLAEAELWINGTPDKEAEGR